MIVCLFVCLLVCLFVCLFVCMMFVCLFFVYRRPDSAPDKKEIRWFTRGEFNREDLQPEVQYYYLLTVFVDSVEYLCVHANYTGNFRHIYGCDVFVVDIDSE